MLNDQVSVVEAEITREPEASRNGRPIGSTKLRPDEETIKRIMGLSRIQCTQKEAAAVLGVHVDTFRAFLNTHENAMIAWEDGKERGKVSLRRQQFKSAASGNATMQIWLGKQILDQSDKADLNMKHSLSDDFEGFIRELHADKTAKTIEHDPVEAAE